MISYKEYKMLMESDMPSVGLGVVTPNNLGGVGNSFGFTPVDASDEAEQLIQSLEEAKKKMFGDEMVDPKNAPPKDKDLDSEEDAEMASKDDDDDDSCDDVDSDDLAMMKKCGKKSKKEEVEAEEANLEEAKKMAKQKKKCGGEMGDMKAIEDMSDDDADMDDDDDDDDADMDDMKDIKKSDDKEDLEMMKKSKKEQDEFNSSLGVQIKGDPKHNRDGISEYLEDAVFTPANVNSSLVSDPSPGDVGFAPEGKIGSVGSYEIGTNEQQDLSTNFMSDWEVIKDLALGVRDN